MMPPETQQDAARHLEQRPVGTLTTSTKAATKPLSRAKVSEILPPPGVTFIPPQLRWRRRMKVEPIPRDAIGRRMSQLPWYYRNELEKAKHTAVQEGIAPLRQFDVAVVSESQVVEWCLVGMGAPFRYETLYVHDPDGRPIGRVFLMRLDEVLVMQS